MVDLATPSSDVVLIERLRERAAQLYRRVTAGEQDRLDLGRALIELKEAVQYGRFTHVIKSFGMAMRTAQVYMAEYQKSIGQKRSGCASVVDNSPPSERIQGVRGSGIQPPTRDGGEADPGTAGPDAGRPGVLGTIEFDEHGEGIDVGDSYEPSADAPDDEPMSPEEEAYWENEAGSTAPVLAGWGGADGKDGDGVLIAGAGTLTPGAGFPSPASPASDEPARGRRPDAVGQVPMAREYELAASTRIVLALIESGLVSPEHMTELARVHSLILERAEHE